MAQYHFVLVRFDVFEGPNLVRFFKFGGPKNTLLEARIYEKLVGSSGGSI